MASDQSCFQVLSKKFSFRSQPERKSVRRNHLIEIAEKLAHGSIIENFYVHMSILTDFEAFEKQEKEGVTLTQNQVQ
jgi:hypothetical protein